MHSTKIDAVIQHLLWLDTDELNQVIHHLGLLNVDGLSRVDRQLDDVVDRLDRLIAAIHYGFDDVIDAIYDAADNDEDAPRKRHETRDSTMQPRSLAQMQHDVQRRINRARGEVR